MLDHKLLPPTISKSTKIILESQLPTSTVIKGLFIASLLLMVARRYILELELWPLDIIILPMTGLSSRQEPKLTVLLQFIILFCERLLILRCKLDIFEKCQMGVPYKALHAGCVDIN